MAKDKKKDARRVVFPASFMAVISILISIYAGFIWTLGGDIFIVIAIFSCIVAGICAKWPNTWWANMGADWFEKLLKNLMGGDKSENGTKTENKVVDNQTGDVRAETGSTATKLNSVFQGPVTVNNTVQTVPPTVPVTTPSESVKEEKETDKEIIEKSKKKLNYIRERRLRGSTPKEMPQIPACPRIYLHIVPYNEQTLLLENIDNNPQNFSKVRSEFKKPVYNTAGILFPSWQNRYLQIYNKGCVEYLYALDDADGRHLLNCYYEYHIRNILLISMATLKQLGVNPPFIVMLSIIELDNFSLYRPHKIFRDWDEIFPIGENDVLSDPVIIHSYDDNLDLVMKTAFQKLWRAAGQPVSLNYDGDKLKQEE